MAESGPNFHTYRRIAALAAIRQRFPALRVGRQYLRPVSLFDGPFLLQGPGELVGWSRILSDEEALCAINGTQTRGGNVVVDADLNQHGMALTVIANSMEAGVGTSAGIVSSIHEVIFCCFSATDLSVYDHLFEKTDRSSP